MAVTAGYLSTVKVSGSSTDFNQLPTTKVTANTVYQITDATKRILDPAVALTVEVDADGGGGGSYATAAASTYTVDYLFGKITFTSDQGVDALVRVSGKYLPTVSVAEVRGYDINMTRLLHDSTAMGQGDADRRFKAGLKEATGSVETFDIDETDLDEAGNGAIIEELADAGTPKLLEINPGGSGVYFRAWVLFEGIEANATPEELQGKRINWKSAQIVGNGQTESAYFGIGS